MFWLTPRVLRLGWSYCDSAKVRARCSPFSSRSAQSSTAPSYFAVLDRTTSSAWHATDRPACTTIRDRGARFCKHLVAGIALLSCLSTREVDRWLAGRAFMPYTPYTVTTQDATRAHQRRPPQGIALLEQQLERKVRGIAVPIRTRNAASSSDRHQPRDGEETTERAITRALPSCRKPSTRCARCVVPSRRAETGRLSTTAGRLTRTSVPAR